MLPLLPLAATDVRATDAVARPGGRSVNPEATAAPKASTRATNATAAAAVAPRVVAAPDRFMAAAAAADLAWLVSRREELQ